MKNEKKDFRLPIEVFKQCPVCTSTDLFHFDEDVFCDCGWDSIASRVEARFAAQGLIYEY